jgi:hypothetical protein
MTEISTEYAVKKDSSLNDQRLLLQNFQARLNAAPNPKEVKENKASGMAKYLPISFIEMTLDEYFFGLWETKDFKWQVCGNEIVGSITLRYKHPVTGDWLERTGAAATMIRLRKDSNVTDISAKIFNALEMDFPHLKADCLVNACRSIGKLFGRDLNRAFEDQYRPLVRQQAEQDGAVTTQVVMATELARLRDTCGHLFDTARLEEQQARDLEYRISESEDITELRAIERQLREHLEEINKGNPALAPKYAGR